MSRRYWRPAVADFSQGSSFGGALPKPGQLIAFSDRRAWRVIDVIDRAVANWRDQTVKAWEKAGRPDPATWEGRERSIGAEPARNPNPNGKDRRGLPLFPWAYQEQWWPLPDPYPACVDCGLLWPCPCDDRNHEAADAMTELDRLGAILPGCCWGCGEPVTSRQHSIEFDGENLLLPGACPALFHTSYSRKAARGPSGNQTCRGDAEKYEQQWVTADPTRKIRLTCPGTLFRHFGYSECTTAVDCPGEDARHSDFTHCTSQTFCWGRDHRPKAEIHPDEIRPATNCGGRGCRGPKVPATPLTTDQPA